MNTTTSQQNKWIIKPRPNAQAKIKLICLPFAGGSSVAYRNWSGVLPDAIELCLVEIPGRGQRLDEALITNLDELVEKTAEGISQELDTPFVLFGHSMGALVGYELTHRLYKKLNKQPLQLFFSGRGAPHLQDRDEPIHALPKNDFVSKIREYDGTPKEVLEHDELMELMIPILRADFQVCETYAYDHREPLDIPLTAFGGLEDMSAPKQDLEAWESHTSKTFAVRMFPGGHFYLQKQAPALLQSMVRDIHAVFKLD